VDIFKAFEGFAGEKVLYIIGWCRLCMVLQERKFCRRESFTY